MNIPNMDGANLGGSTKILNFEEFCAAQSGGMAAPGGDMPAEPATPEMEMPATETEGGDDVTVLDDTDAAAGTPAEPEDGEKPEETPAVD